MKRNVKQRPSPGAIAWGFLVFAGFWLMVGTIASAAGFCCLRVALVSAIGCLCFSAVFGLLQRILNSIDE